MTPEQISQIQHSFGKIAVNKAAAAAQFYDRLFELDPSLRPLFKGNMGAQGEKLMMTIATAVRNIKNPAVIEKSLRDLGKRHKAYGVKNEHYDTVGAALLWTLEKNMGSEFTPELRKAWATMYGTVAGIMIAS